MRYQLTASAVRDISEILHQIRTVQQSPQNASLVARRLRQQFRKLAQTPHLGHTRPELNDPNTRAISVSGLLVLYDPATRPLTILRVIHGARDLSRITHR
jgi:plasmid stabilization system protein ParE